MKISKPRKRRRGPKVNAPQTRLRLCNPFRWTNCGTAWTYSIRMLGSTQYPAAIPSSPAVQVSKLYLPERASENTMATDMLEVKEQDRTCSADERDKRPRGSIWPWKLPFARADSYDRVESQGRRGAEEQLEVVGSAGKDAVIKIIQADGKIQVVDMDGRIKAEIIAVPGPTGATGADSAIPGPIGPQGKPGVSPSLSEIVAAVVKAISSRLS